MKSHCNELKLKAAHMLHHDHHEFACAKSFTFIHTTVVCDVLLLVAAKCQEGRRKWRSSRINNSDSECR